MPYFYSHPKTVKEVENLSVLGYLLIKHTVLNFVAKVLQTTREDGRVVKVLSDCVCGYFSLLIII